MKDFIIIRTDKTITKYNKKYYKIIDNILYKLFLLPNGEKGYNFVKTLKG